MDENRSDNIDKLFRDSLQSSKREPSKDIWENIEQELDSHDRHSSLVRFRFVSLISASLLALVVCLWLLSPKAPRKGITASDNSGPGSKEKAIAKGVTGGAGQARTDSSVLRYFAVPTRLNNESRTHLRSRGNTNTYDLKFRKSGKTMHTENANFDQSGDNTNTLYSKFVQSAGPTHANPQVQGKLGLATLKIDAEEPEPDPAQLLLKDKISKFKTTSPGNLRHQWSRWSVTGYFSKEFAGYSLADHDSLAANGREVDKKEKPFYSASAVVLVDYILSRNWILQSGFSYSWSNSLANPTTSYVVSNNGQLKYRVNTVSGYGYLPVSQSVPTQVGDSVITGKSFTKLNYISMPFIGSYKFRLRKFTFMTGMGFTLNLLTSATLETKIQGASLNQDEVKVKMYGLKRMNYGAVIKAELQYPIYKNWSLDLVASFRNTLTPINLHTVITTYPYNLGIGLGISHSF